MSFTNPTYEEYFQATKFARFRYRFGIFVLILCWIALLFIAYFIFIYGNYMASHPLTIAAKEYEMDCECDCYWYNVDYKYDVPFRLDFNSTTVVINGGGMRNILKVINQSIIINQS